MSTVLVSTLNVQRRGIHTNRHTGWPVGSHLTILVVEALELQLQVGSTEEEHSMKSTDLVGIVLTYGMKSSRVYMTLTQGITLVSNIVNLLTPNI